MPMKLFFYSIIFITYLHGYRCSHDLINNNRSRPDLEFTYLSELGNFMIHYDNEGNNAPNPLNENGNLIPDYIESVYEELFLMKYHGGWSFFEAYNLPITIRRWFLKRLAKQMEDEDLMIGCLDFHFRKVLKAVLLSCLKFLKEIRLKLHEVLLRS